MHVCVSVVVCELDVSCGCTVVCVWHNEYLCERSSDGVGIGGGV